MTSPEHIKHNFPFTCINYAIEFWMYYWLSMNFAHEKFKIKVYGRELNSVWFCTTKNVFGIDSYLDINFFYWYILWMQFSIINVIAVIENSTRSTEQIENYLINLLELKLNDKIIIVTKFHYKKKLNFK